MTLFFVHSGGIQCTLFRNASALLKDGAIVTDVSSTKVSIHQAVKELKMEDCFVGGHPMAGSEKTGYENSTDHLLENAYYIITPTPVSRQEDVEEMVAVARLIGCHSD